MVMARSLRVLLAFAFKYIRILVANTGGGNNLMETVSIIL